MNSILGINWKRVIDLRPFYRRFTEEDIWILQFSFKVITVNERQKTKTNGKNKIPCIRFGGNQNEKESN